MTDGFHVAMLACAGLAAAGGILAWLTISSEVLHEEPDEPPERPEYCCPIAGTPLRPAPELVPDPAPLKHQSASVSA